jgi:hypothetical protein
MRRIYQLCDKILTNMPKRRRTGPPECTSGQLCECATNYCVSTVTNLKTHRYVIKESVRNHEERHKLLF